MKKVLSLTLVIVSLAGTAFATQEKTTAGGMTIKGGADATAAAAAATPLIKFSTGVWGVINYTADTTAKTSTGYLIGTRHTTGSKDFGTANTVTNIYWKQAGTTGTTIADKLATDMGTSDVATTVFAAGNGWTSY